MEEARHKRMGTRLSIYQSLRTADSSMLIEVLEDEARNGEVGELK